MSNPLFRKFSQQSQLQKTVQASLANLNRLHQKTEPQVRQQILLDIEVIDQLREDVKDRYSYFTYLWLAMTSRRRKQFSQMRLQQELEALANNNLYVQASKLSHMAGVGPK